MGGLCSGHCIVVPPGVKNSHFPGDMRRDTCLVNGAGLSKQYKSCQNGLKLS